jgi:hypothetical protein
MRSDWTGVNKFRVTSASRVVPPEYVTTNQDHGFGMFRIPHNGQLIRCVVSDGAGWEHVSVSVEGDTRPTRWT